jgi:hypothetical protein
VLEGEREPVDCCLGELQRLGEFRLGCPAGAPRKFLKKSEAALQGRGMKVRCGGVIFHQ